MLTFDFTGSSPTLTNSVVFSQGSTSTDVTLTGGSGVNSARNPGELVTSNGYIMTTGARTTLWNETGAFALLPPLVPNGLSCPGQGAAESFSSQSLSGTAKTTAFRMEAAA